MVRFRWERSFDRSYCRKKVGTDGNPFHNSKTYHYEKRGSAQVWQGDGYLTDLSYQIFWRILIFGVRCPSFLATNAKLIIARERGSVADLAATNTYGRFTCRQKTLQKDRRDPKISEKQIIRKYPIETLFLDHLKLLLFQGLEILFQLRSDFDDVLITRIFCIDNI